MDTEITPRPRPQLRQSGIIRETISLLVFVVAVFTLLQLAMPRSIVHGSSMEPTFKEGQYLVISRVNYLLGDPERGDIIVFNSPVADPGDPSLIKRVIGLPGDFVEIRDTLVYVNGQLLDESYINEPCRARNCPDADWELDQDEYFVMGDNRNVSNDSRSFGPVSYDRIIGEVLLRYWPLDELGIVHQYRFE
jgi:signal peptidase I